MRDRPAAFRFGRSAETRTVWWYRLRGYSILGRNIRIGGGEIDIIVRRFRTIAFVEVKARRGAAPEHPAQSIDAAKRGQIIRAAKAWRASNPPGGDFTFRYDVACLIGDEAGGKLQVWQAAFVDEGESGKRGRRDKKRAARRRP